MTAKLSRASEGFRPAPGLAESLSGASQGSPCHPRVSRQRCPGFVGVNRIGMVSPMPIRLAPTGGRVRVACDRRKCPVGGETCRDGGRRRRARRPASAATLPSAQRSPDHSPRLRPNAHRARLPQPLPDDGGLRGVSVRSPIPSGIRLSALRHPWRAVPFRQSAHAVSSSRLSTGYQLDRRDDHAGHPPAIAALVPRGLLGHEAHAGHERRAVSEARRDEAVRDGLQPPAQATSWDGPSGA